MLVGICHIATTLTFSCDHLLGTAPNAAWTTHLILPRAKAFVEAVNVVFKSRLAWEQYETQKTKEMEALMSTFVKVSWSPANRAAGQICAVCVVAA